MVSTPFEKNNIVNTGVFPNFRSENQQKTYLSGHHPENNTRHKKKHFVGKQVCALSSPYYPTCFWGNSVIPTPGTRVGTVHPPRHKVVKYSDLTHVKVAFFLAKKQKNGFKQLEVVFFLEGIQRYTVFVYKCQGQYVS